jgi:hypothetical protein
MQFHLRLGLGLLACAQQALYTTDEHCYWQWARFWYTYERETNIVSDLHPEVPKQHLVTTQHLRAYRKSRLSTRPVQTL